MQEQILAKPITDEHGSSAKRSNFDLLQTLSSAAFRYPGLRIALEVTVALVLFCAASVFVPWSELTALNAKWYPLIAWAMTCSLISFFDLRLFSGPVGIYEQALSMELLGSYAEALQTIEPIGPNGRTALRLPRDLYHQFRAKTLMHSGKIAEAEQELKLALQFGLPVSHAEQLICEPFSAERSVRRVDSCSALVKFEQAIQTLRDHTDRLLAKRQLQDVLQLPAELHPSGASTDRLARPFFHCARLWTGEAEEALPRFSRELLALHSRALVVESLRPYAALLYAERARYLAKHKERGRARQDLRAALKFCRYPAILSAVKEVRELLKG